MTNVIIPIFYYWMVVGKTINIRNYDLARSDRRIYNETDVVENPVSCSFNASYYVLSDGNIPYEKIGVPIDYLLRAKYQGSGSGLKSMLTGYSILTADNSDNAIVLVLAQCKTSEETVKENANPIPNWQDNIPQREKQTHYVDKIVHGSQVISILRIRSRVLSDVQVFRRILKDIMGTSGTVTENTPELWKIAEKTIRESPDVRGEIAIDDYTKISNARKPDSFGNNENLLRYVSNFPDFVDPTPAVGYIRNPLYVSFKPLHDLDDTYPSLQKDTDGERYLQKLYRLMKDTTLAKDEFQFINRYWSEVNEMKFLDFILNLYNVSRTLESVFHKSLSTFEYIDKEALSAAFALYQKSLDNTTEDYMTLFRKTREKMDTAITCGSDFLSPTRGQLRVNEDEVVKKGRVEDVENCSDFCVEDERCRAIGYSEKDMTNVLLPIYYYWMVVGKTINIREYDLANPNRRIYNETDVVENPVSCSFNATYYVLPDGNIPYEKVGVPIDYLLRAKYQGSNSELKSMLTGYSILTADNSDNAIVLILAQCKTSEETVKENANPIPNWQDKIPQRENQTHYVDKIVHGSQVISILRVRSSVPSDVQIFRRILQDIMGTSGTVTANTVELWKIAEKTIRESPDVRGDIVFDDYTKIWNARKPAFGNNEHVLRYVSNFPDIVVPIPAGGHIRNPLYVSFKPLHDLDDTYPSLQKDTDGERYLAKLYRLMKDTKSAKDKFLYVNRFLSEENEMKFLDFILNLYNVSRTLESVFHESLSTYEYIDKEALSAAFALYQQSLDNTTEDYMTLFRKTREKMDTAVTCGSDFLSPTRGQLRVNEEEVVKKGRVEDFENCSDFCVEDERCRAIGYSEKECLIYYRSTYSATITLLPGDLEVMKIYDRKCRFN